MRQVKRIAENIQKSNLNTIDAPFSNRLDPSPDKQDKYVNKAIFWQKSTENGF